MEKSTYRPLLILIALTASAALAVTYGVDVRADRAPTLRTTLPDQVGAWQGVALLFCQSQACGKDFTADEVSAADPCPACGGKLDTASAIERTLLPPDTIILKELYTHPSGRMLYVAIVMSGSDRSSIHRPQLCLVGQGNEIVGSRTVAVPVAPERNMNLMLLDLSRRLGNGRRLDTFFAYWFAGRNRETPYHVARMFWMGWDRIVHSVSYRWSYISISGLRSGTSGHDAREVSDFVRDFHPLLKPAT